MSDYGLTIIEAHIPRTCEEVVRSVDALEQAFKLNEQTVIPTHHVLHGGMYARTITIPAGIAITGALIKRATLLIVEGQGMVYAGEGGRKINGYKVFSASAHRKQVFVAETDLNMTMVFPTSAKTIDEAEQEFTDDFESLWSRNPDAVNHVNITGE